MSAVSNDGAEVIIESHGKPKAVVISYDEYEDLRQLRKQRQRADAFAKLRELEQRIGDRNKDLSEEEIEELSNRFSHEFIEDLAREGKIRFERDMNR